MPSCVSYYCTLEKLLDTVVHRHALSKPFAEQLDLMKEHAKQEGVAIKQADGHVQHYHICNTRSPVIEGEK